MGGYLHVISESKGEVSMDFFHVGMTARREQMYLFPRKLAKTRVVDTGTLKETSPTLLMESFQTCILEPPFSELNVITNCTISSCCRFYVPDVCVTPAWISSIMAFINHSKACSQSSTEG